MEKPFILGIGSQRAGSTFITRLLNQHPKIAIHPIKELHYFDTVAGIRNESVLKEFSQNQVKREINRLCSAKETEFITPMWQWYLKSNYQLSTTAIADLNYFDLFSSFSGLEQVKFIGESTPEYMLLNEAQIKSIKNIVGNAHVIIMCRNPVKRITSSFRLLLEYGRKKVSHTQKEFDSLFLDLIKKNDIWVKQQILYNDYVRAISNYQKSFDRVLFLSYDDVVEEPDKILNSLTKFINLDFNSDKMTSLFKKKINSLSVEYSPGDEVKEKLEQILKKQNDDVAKIFNRPLIH